MRDLKSSIHEILFVDKVIPLDEDMPDAINDQPTDSMY